jgi:hypothetical protein
MTEKQEKVAFLRNTFFALDCFLAALLAMTGRVRRGKENSSCGAAINQVRHCEERSEEAIQTARFCNSIACPDLNVNFMDIMGYL